MPTKIMDDDPHPPSYYPITHINGTPVIVW